MPRKEQRPKEAEKPDRWERARTLALFFDTVVRIASDIFDKR